MDFGEYLADLAADGIDISVPFPRRQKKPQPEQEPIEEELDDDKPTAIPSGS